ncbi:MAG: hypothetical protein FWE91_07390 [Defluviitaleaceae bacterium]|nr:hypothetical protein [Defluviitaleaceae bacterium]MCL2837064.1 hypothetical protein [Defluviitaleaceae bacterium]
MLCKQCKTSFQLAESANADTKKCPVCGAAAAHGRGKIMVLVAVLITIFCAGAVYLFLSLSGRLSNQPEGHQGDGVQFVSAEETSFDQSISGAENVAIPDDEPDDEDADERDPVVAMLAEAAAAAELELLSGSYVTNRGFLYNTANESFVTAEPTDLGNPMLLYLLSSDLLHEGQAGLAGEGRMELRVYAALDAADSIVITDSEGRSGAVYRDRFNALLARYDNIHGEPYKPDERDPMRQELVQLATAYTYSGAGYELLRLSADERYAYAEMLELEDGYIHVFVFEYNDDGWFVAASWLGQETVPRVAVNGVLPDFNPALLPCGGIFDEVSDEYIHE